MKKQLFIAIISLALLITPSVVSAQMGRSTEAVSDGHTAREEAEGKEVWEKLQAKQLECKDLTNDNFETLGEYFMGRMVGSSHAAMNTMMEQMMGKQGEEQMHVVMGKRLSGCDASAQLPQNGVGLMPMMNMMMGMMGSAGSPQVGGGGNPMPALSAVEGMGYGGWNNMMGGWGGFGIFGWLSMIIFWLLLLLGVIALVKWLTLSGRKDVSKTPFEILKERYAKGEIDKKEFEQKKKDLEYMKQNINQ